MSSVVEQEIEIEGIVARLQRKRVRGIRLRVVAPKGEVRVSAPVLVPEERIRAFVQSKAEWIRKHQERMRSIVWKAPLQYTTGEMHWYLGREVPLEYHVVDRKPMVIFTGDRIVMTGRPRMGRLQRRGVLYQGYKEELQRIVPELVRKYEKMMGVSVTRIRYRTMSTRWGTCATVKRIVTVNTELAKKSPGAIEMLVVHELAHLLERKHNDRFYRLMTEFMPEWKKYDRELNRIDNG